MPLRQWLHHHQLQQHPYNDDNRAPHADHTERDRYNSKALQGAPMPTTTTDEYYLGTNATSLETKEERTRLVQRLRQYLELRNLSILIGNGCSIPLGAPLIHSTANIRAELDNDPYRLTNNEQQQHATSLLDDLLTLRDIGIEPLLTILANIQANERLLGTPTLLGKRTLHATDAEALERLLKKWLYLRCAPLHDQPIEHHKELLRRILLRSTNLPRAKVFTTNYDLVLERTLDELGVLYFDGFLGTINRSLRTESYHYDLYYPGETTEGRVSRVDRVLHLYKMHGSINWRRQTGDASDVRISPTANEDTYADVMIYPSPLKVTEIHGYPYAEMFRHFSASIHQPQTALITIGYRFADEHINRLIYQALTIPSFTLIIVIPSIDAPPDTTAPGAEHEIWRLVNSVASNRILVITGGQTDTNGQYVSGVGTIQGFSTLLPDIAELNVERKAREETISALAPLTRTRNGD